MKYKQLTQIQRYQIYALMKMGHRKIEIAKALSVHRSTISRELKRNRGNRGYRPQQADRKARIRSKKGRYRITKETWNKVEGKLREEWSPEQISRRLREEKQQQISPEWIYQYIYADKRAGGMLWKYLRRQKKRRKRAGGRDRRGQIPNRVSIEQRPEEANQRERLGDWEGDTIIGKGHKGAVLTLVDRKSGYTLLGQMPRREAELVLEQAGKLLKQTLHTKTLTVDNGKEFAKHQEIKKETGVDVYFAHPYASWERGTNENTNGLIRQYLPKNRMLDNVQKSEMDEIMEKLNHRPRKRLGFRTPFEVYFGVSVALMS